MKKAFLTAVLLCGTMITAGCGDAVEGTRQELIKSTTKAFETIDGTHDEMVRISADLMRRFAKADLCEMSKQDWFDFAGGTAVGSTVTGMAAGESILILVTQAGVLSVTAPAIATGVTIATGTAAVSYAGTKAFCKSR